jgi:hypothetical protein
MTKANIVQYKGFYIVTNPKRSQADLVSPFGKFRVVKSSQAAKWRITRTLNLSSKFNLI